MCDCGNFLNTPMMHTHTYLYSFNVNMYAVQTIFFLLFIMHVYTYVHDKCSFTTISLKIQSVDPLRAASFGYTRRKEMHQQFLKWEIRFKSSYGTTPEKSRYISSDVINFLKSEQNNILGRYWKQRTFLISRLIRWW